MTVTRAWFFAAALNKVTPPAKKQAQLKVIYTSTHADQGLTPDSTQYRHYTMPSVWKTQLLIQTTTLELYPGIPYRNFLRASLYHQHQPLPSICVQSLASKLTFQTQETTHQCQSAPLHHPLWHLGRPQFWWMGTDCTLQFWQEQGNTYMLCPKQSRYQWKICFLYSEKTTMKDLINTQKNEILND